MAAVSAQAPVRARERSGWPVVARGFATAGIVLLVTVAGVGWLDLLRRAGLLGAGPRVAGALSLERLAGADAQPLLRVVVAWLPAGLIAGVALRAAGVRGRTARAAVAGVPSLVLLLLAGAAADAIAESEPLASHLSAQPHRAAPWVAAVLVALGAAAPHARRR